MRWKLPPILSPRPSPDESHFEWRVCPFCRGCLEMDAIEDRMTCLACGRNWQRHYIEQIGNEEP